MHFSKCFNFVVLLTALFFFVVPFFWFQPGFVDLGGDAGKLYLYDPLNSALNLFKNQNAAWATMYSMLSYEIFLSLIHRIVISPTSMVALEHGLQLSLGFYSMYLIIKKLFLLTSKSNDNVVMYIASMLGGIVYVALVTKVGWPISMQTQNQIFLNPLTFYLLLNLFTTFYIYDVIMFLLLTILYGGNFGYTSMPQIMSFFPLAIIFIFLLLKFVRRATLPWKQLLMIGVLFVGIHAYHLVPTLATIMDTGSATFNSIFSEETIQNSAVNYFDVNHLSLGSISTELFQPSKWNGQNVFIFIIPLITIMGFLRKPSKLLWLLGVFFAITFFLVSANITLIGERFYRILFYIPGFKMFRSFDEKWYFVYSFFYGLLFSVSFYHLLEQKRKILISFFGFLVVVSIGFRIYPFLKGESVNVTHYQSNNVSTNFEMDPDLVESVNYIRKIPNNGNFLTLPLTFPYFQVAYGLKGGAYSGVSIVLNLGGKKDYPGFWSFGMYKDSIFNSLQQENLTSVTQLLSLLNVRYIFWNRDTRIMENFPGYPYIYGGDKYDDKEKIPLIKNQNSYANVLERLPITKIFEKGYYQIFEIKDDYIRPTIYIPDSLYLSQKEALKADSYRSAYMDEADCKFLAQYNYDCKAISTDNKLPKVTYSKLSETRYELVLDNLTYQKPFLLVLSDNYDRSWELELKGIHPKEGITHVRINDYANGWIIDPIKLNLSGTIKGELNLNFQKYYAMGEIISILTILGILSCLFVRGIKNKYEKK